MMSFHPVAHQITALLGANLRDPQVSHVRGANHAPVRQQELSDRLSGGVEADDRTSAAVAAQCKPDALVDVHREFRYRGRAMRHELHSTLTILGVIAPAGSGDAVD